MVDTETRKLVEKLWDYHHLNHKLEKADCVLVLGSHDARVAEYGAQLFLDGWAPLLIISGGLGSLTKGLWGMTEAERFSQIALDMGVPKEKMLVEDKSTNTGENILFTKQLLYETGINPKKFITVQKPYMERRAYATFKKVWSEKEVIVASPNVPFSEYPTDYIKEEQVINIVVGDLQRIRVYADKGFQIPQEIPDDVWDAYEKLVKKGYDKRLV